MADRQTPGPIKKPVIPHASFKASVLGWIAAQFVRLLGWTLRIQLQDQAAAGQVPLGTPCIWLFWHNRILGMPRAYRKWFKRRKMVVLTSASRDGAILAKVMERFGIGSVRGSSSKRGALALAELRAAMEAGMDAVFTPDGPRGPCYRLAPGPIKLAQLAGAPIFPIHVSYAKCWRLKSWDRFMIPKPFSKVTVTFISRVAIDPAADGETFEAERQRVEALLRPPPGEE